VTGWSTSNKRVHAVLPVAFISAQLAYLTLSALDRITAG